MSFGKMPESDREALLEHVSRLKHDLGKYIRFQGRWLADDATLESRRDALAADLLHTRRGPNGSVDAATVWAEFAPKLRGAAPLANATVDLSNDPDVALVIAGMDALEPVIAALRAGSADAATVQTGERAATSVADAIRSLVKRVRSGEMERDPPRDVG